MASKGRITRSSIHSTKATGGSEGPGVLFRMLCFTSHSRKAEGPGTARLGSFGHFTLVGPLSTDGTLPDLEPQEVQANICCLVMSDTDRSLQFPRPAFLHLAGLTLLLTHSHSIHQWLSCPPRALTS